MTELGELAHESPGKTQLFFQFVDQSKRRRILLRSQSTAIDVKPALLNYIEQSSALSYKIN